MTEEAHLNKKKKKLFFLCLEWISWTFSLSRLTRPDLWLRVTGRHLCKVTMWSSSATVHITLLQLHFPRAQPFFSQLTIQLLPTLVHLITVAPAHNSLHAVVMILMKSLCFCLRCSSKTIWLGTHFRLKGFETLDYLHFWLKLKYRPAKCFFCKSNKYSVKGLLVFVEVCLIYLRYDRSEITWWCSLLNPNMSVCTVADADITLMIQSVYSSHVIEATIETSDLSLFIQCSIHK